MSLGHLERNLILTTLSYVLIVISLIGIAGSGFLLRPKGERSRTVAEMPSVGEQPVPSVFGQARLSFGSDALFPPPRCPVSRVPAGSSPTLPQPEKRIRDEWPVIRSQWRRGELRC